MNAETLNCPSCGAAVSKDSTLCQYCGALLQTVACPACLGMMFRGSKFCPHCGVAVATAQVGPSVNRLCPRCQVELKTVQIGRQHLEECPHCGGMWVDARLFQQICNDQEAQTAAIGLKLPPPPPDVAESVRYLKCPQCGNLMNRTQYSHHSGVIIDVCQNDGIWIDRDGLRQIVEFIRAGGLTRARAYDIEEAKLAQRDAANRQQTTDYYSDAALGGALSNLGSFHHRSSGLDVVPAIASLIWQIFK